MRIEPGNPEIEIINHTKLISNQGEMFSEIGQYINFS